MAGKRKRLGRVHEPGKALSEPLREEIIKMYNEGFGLTDISKDVKVTVRGINKIINHYAHHGTLIPFCHGSSEADAVTDDVLHCIEIWKLQRLSIYARVLQNRLLLEGICDRDKLPSISAINRSLSGNLETYKSAKRIRCQPSLISFPPLREKSWCLAFQIWYKSFVHLSSIGSSLVLNFPLFTCRTDYLNE